jgi:hypothetical protein
MLAELRDSSELMSVETRKLAALRSNLSGRQTIQDGQSEETVQRLDFVDRAARPFPLSLVFLVAFLVHAPLLLMQLPLKSYDTNFHIFFASHYSQHWFDPWNPKWYAGFSQTTYPPLPQQWIAVVSRVTGLDMGYMLVQFVAILLLALGVYRVVGGSPRRFLRRSGQRAAGL